MAPITAKMNINYSRIMQDMLHIAVQTRTAELSTYVSMETKRTVQSGPFIGMFLPEEVSWGNGDVLPKLFGTYEQELHPAIEKAISRTPEVVFNVGCAEGYYAVGLACRLPKVPVYAFDTDKKAREICHGSINANYVFRAVVKEEFSRAYVEPRQYLRPSLLVMDIEGGEVALLEGEIVGALSLCDLIIECHDFSHPGTTTELVKRFEETHDIEVIEQGPRNPHSIPLLKPFGDLDKAIALCENRPSSMTWLACWSKLR